MAPFLLAVTIPAVLLSGQAQVPSAPVSFAEQGGRFAREYWFVHSMEHGNPVTNRRFRVNAPEVVLHRNWGGRSEVRSSGMLQIRMDEDPRRIEGVDLYVELWGGHPGTANKRVTINGRSTYFIPKVGTEEQHCTHVYPVIPLKLTDVVNGYNALQFTCDRGTAGWGHYIVEGAALRAFLKKDHPDLVKAGLDTFDAGVAAVTDTQAEKIRVSLAVPPGFEQRVVSVRFQGYYKGYDENGDRAEPGWHGLTLKQQPIGLLGTAGAAPFAVEWDTSMLPAQTGVMVRARLAFRDDPLLVYFTTPATGLAIAERAGVVVKLHAASELPAPFRSRVRQKKTARINLDTDPALIERALLHITVWDGGCGTVQNCISLNGEPLPITGKGSHNLNYAVVDVDPRKLRRSGNVVEVLSDTGHHGIEILLPGPVLAIREKTK